MALLLPKCHSQVILAKPRSIFSFVFHSIHRQISFDILFFSWSILVFLQFDVQHIYRNLNQCHLSFAFNNCVVKMSCWQIIEIHIDDWCILEKSYSFQFFCSAWFHTWLNRKTVTFLPTGAKSPYCGGFIDENKPTLHFNELFKFMIHCADF